MLIVSSNADNPECRRWFQFSMRTILLAALVLSLPLSWFAARMARDAGEKGA